MLIVLISCLSPEKFTQEYKSHSQVNANHSQLLFSDKPSLPFTHNPKLNVLVNLDRVAAKQSQFVFPLQFFDCGFSSTRRCPAMPIFDENDPLGATTSKIFGAFLGSMLMKAPVYIGGDTGIQAAIATENHIDRPTHL
jgi:hypothetical protein